MILLERETQYCTSTVSSHCPVGHNLSQNFTGGNDAESLVRSLASLAEVGEFPAPGPGTGQQRDTLVLR